MKDKVIVLGAGKSGISAASLLIKIGGYVLLYDANEKIDTEKIKKEISDDDKLTIKLGKLSDEDIENVSICVISPGIDPSSEVPQKLVKHGIQLWSEIQLGYHVAKGRLFAITGTNGKTTTTSLLGAICANFYPETLCVGNIGIPYTSKALDTTNSPILLCMIISSCRR